MHEKDFLPGQKLPIEILPVHNAWAEMQKKLEDENPSSIVVLQTDATRTSYLQKRILRASLLLILLFITLFFVNQLNKGDNDLNTIATNQKDTKANDKDQNKKTIDSPKEENLKNDNEISDQDQNKDEIRYGMEINGPENNIESKGLGLNDKKANDIVIRNKNSKKQNTSSKKQEIKKTNRAHGVNDNNEKDKLVDNNTPSEMQVITQDASVQKKSIEDSTAEVKTKNEIKKNSSANTILHSEESIPQYKPTLSFGLHWNFQLPVYSADNYFKGSSASSQPYIVLLPGVWLSVKQDNYLLRAELNPFYSNLLPPRPFGTFTTYNNTTDTIVITTETKTLRKTFGINLSANYNYNISGNWWAGGGIHANWQRKGIASANGIEERRSISNGGVVTNGINHNYTLTKTEWENFARFQIGIHAEANYMIKKMQTGFRIGLPITPIAKHKGQTNSIRTEVIFRLPLFSSGRKIVN